MKWSRRKILAMLGRLPVLSLGGGATACFGRTELSVDRLHSEGSAWPTGQSACYRADVSVGLLGIPLFGRRGVGSAWGEIREQTRGERRHYALSFAGGADPARTHGIHYLGSFEEVAIEAESTLEQAATFGFVTVSSSDESFEQARQRVTDGNKGKPGTFVVVDELHRASSVRIRRMFVPAAGASWRELPRLDREVRAQFGDSAPLEREVRVSPKEGPRTFLRTVVAAIRSPQPRCNFAYLHDGSRYILECEKQHESTGGADTVRLNGRIRDLDKKKVSTFKLWYAQGADPPVRIEFSPRSYLRITLESDPAIRSTVATEEEI
jgi:hypothetical protein